MSRTRLMLGTLAALGMAGAAFADHPQGFTGRVLETELDGASEVPGPGDPDGSGIARVWLNLGQSEVCYDLSVLDIEPATAAHIHLAPAGQAGPVSIPLAAPTNGSSSGCIMVDQAIIKNLIQNPQDYYVNVHNATFPGGAVRGQLRKKNQ